MESTITSQQPPEYATPDEWFHKLATHNVEAQIYFHLNQCGAFQLLKDGSTIENMVSELNLDERILRILLEYTASVGDIIHVTSEGLYELTDFGQMVAKRYSKVNGDNVTYNIFDVRVGAWGPVWVSLGDMLRKTKVYGVDLHREGDFAADALFKLAAPLAASVGSAADELGATAIVEIGPTSGILAQLASSTSDVERRYAGVDIKKESLDFVSNLAQEGNVNSIDWYLGDLFEPTSWMNSFKDEEKVMYFSCHFHEFLSHGIQNTKNALETVTAAPNTAGILALEQPRLEKDQRDSCSQTGWLYSQSNVFIHHLIKNAHILSSPEWVKFLSESGCDEVRVEDTQCFAFSAYLGVNSH